MKTALTNTNEHQDNEKTDPIWDFGFWIGDHSSDDARRLGMHFPGGKGTGIDDYCCSRRFGEPGNVTRCFSAGKSGDGRSGLKG